MSRKGTIEEMRRIASERGGQCLSTNYVNAHEKLMWQCRSGHQWTAAPYSIKQGKWCPGCARWTRKWSIERVQKLAGERGGACLSTNYTNTSAKLRWQCQKGHQWEAATGHIALGRWCPVCAGTKKLTIEQMQKIAGERGGQCLSTNYVNAYEKLRWRCQEGHCWEASANHVKSGGTWCPVCAGKKKLTIEQMQ